VWETKCHGKVKTCGTARGPWGARAPRAVNQGVLVSLTRSAFREGGCADLLTSTQKSCIV
jgi:hypothetical protein